MRPTSASSARRSAALRSGSVSFQKAWEPRLPGTTLTASAADEKRGSLPAASSRPAPIWTPAVTFATVSALVGHVGADGIGQLAESLEGGAGGVGGGLGAAQRLDSAGDEGGGQHGARDSSDQHVRGIPR